MKSLYLLRHTTASEAGLGQSDVDRPLNRRGLREAAEVGSQLTSGAQAPTAVLCSGARRALDTLNQIRPHLGAETEIYEDMGLYNADCEKILQRIRGLEQRAEGVLVIAHNPGIASLAVSLVAAGDAALIQQLARRYPPGALAVLNFDLTCWSELDDQMGTLAAFTQPSAS